MTYVLYAIIIIGGIFELSLFIFRKETESLFASLFFLTYGIGSLIDEIFKIKPVLYTGYVLTLIFAVLWIVSYQKRRKRENSSIQNTAVVNEDELKDDIKEK